MKVTACTMRDTTSKLFKVMLKVMLFSSINNINKILQINDSHVGQLVQKTVPCQQNHKETSPTQKSVKVNLQLSVMTKNKQFILKMNYISLYL